jgi:hypothetical protein
VAIENLEKAHDFSTNKVLSIVFWGYIYSHPKNQAASE